MQLVDWELAAATATRLVPPGPRLPIDEARAIVEELRELAVEADGHVVSFTGLTPAGDMTAPVAVVDRPGWIRSNVDGFRELLDPLLDTITASRSTSL